MNETPLITRSVLLFALAFSLLIIALQTVQPTLLYKREAILAGEVWRIWSGNLVHTNYQHMLLNLAGLWIFLLLCGSAISLKLLISSIFITSTVISGTLLYLHPEIHWYAGLSGVLYGLFLIGAACLAIAGEILSFFALLSLIALKLGSTWFSDSDAVTQTMIQARIVDEAHIYGAIAGGITIFCWLAYRCIDKKNRTGAD